MSCGRIKLDRRFYVLVLPRGADKTCQTVSCGRAGPMAITTGRTQAGLTAFPVTIA